VTDHDGGRRESPRTWLLLALILALAAIVRVLSFRGYVTFDPAEYARLAHMMTSGEFRPGMLWFFPVFSVRVGLFAPVALAFRIGGVNEVTLTAYPFLLSMLGVFVAFFAAKLMFGARAGHIAACVVAFLPIEARHASQLFPDMPAAFWMNVGVLLILVGSRQEAVPRKAACGALAGLALFASWLCKETMLYVLPFVGLYMLWLVARDRRNVALLLATTVVAAFLVGLEGWIYHREAGDYLLRYNALRRNSEGVRGAIPAWTMANAAHYFVGRSAEIFRTTFLNVDDFVFLPAGALIACAYAILRRDRRFLLPGLWFGWLVVLFSFGSASLKVYAPLHSYVTRFQYPLLLPSVLVVAGLANSLLSPPGPTESEESRRTRLFSRLFLITYLVVMSLVAVAWGIRSGMGRKCRVERAMARALRPTDTLYTDGHTAIALQFFWKFPATCSAHDFEGMSLAQIPTGAYVLLNRDELDAMCRIDKYVPPVFRDSVPSTWQRLRDKDNATLFRVPPLLLSN
jgi:4-amino-4-deoxy-L-arabinose transferase-like glycosyltransferase